MKAVLTLILILLPLIVLSQKVSINQEKETITLNKKKAIEVAKIIENEKRLIEYIEDLESMVVNLNDSIQVYAARNKRSLDKIEYMFTHVGDVNKKVNELYDKQLELERKLRKFGLLNNDGFNSIDMGFAYANRKKLFTLSLDPFSFNGLSYKLGFGMKIF